MQIKHIISKRKWFDYFVGKGFFNRMSDEEFLKIKYKIYVGSTLNLNCPKNFSEKIQWLKLHDRKDIYTCLVDKYEAKKYVAAQIGDEHIIPTLGVWDSFDEIDFNLLPNRFVLKCTHDCGGLAVCRDKSFFDYQKAEYNIKNSLKKNFYYIGREWPYKNVKPRIIAEEFINDPLVENAPEFGESPDGLIDYKFYCFNGVPKFLYVSFSNIKNDKKSDFLSFYDLKGQSVPFYRNLPQLPFSIDLSGRMDEMVKIAKILSKDIPFVRVDLYYVNNTVLFSEMTFSPGSGFSPFLPEAWEREIGNWIALPNIDYKFY